MSQRTLIPAVGFCAFAALAYVVLGNRRNQDENNQRRESQENTIHAQSQKIREFSQKMQQYEQNIKKLESEKMALQQEIDKLSNNDKKGGFEMQKSLGIIDAQKKEIQEYEQNITKLESENRALKWAYVLSLVIGGIYVIDTNNKGEYNLSSSNVLRLKSNV